MDGFAGAIGVSDSDGKVSPVVHLYDAGDGDARYFAYALREAARAGYVTSLAKGIRERSTSFDPQTLSAMDLPVPPLATQRRIADYLDRETAAIDALIEKQRKVKKLGTARKQAVIDSAVASPEVLPLKRDAALVTSGPRGWAQFYASSGQRFIRITDIQRDSIKLGDQSVRYVDTPDAGEAQRASTRVGDLVVSITADLGSVGLIDKAHAGAVVSQHVAIVRLAGRHWVSRFAAYALKSSPLKDQFAGAAYGGTKVQLSLGDVRDLEVPAPPLPEQRAIANQLDRETAKIDALIAKAERFIELAQERRAALITAAVTGQLEIPAEESSA
ncbi:restriction endonuclease subunit S [Micrococcus flavus]|nr:restriction endonuclease subunit S [Micrococcus flavus]